MQEFYLILSHTWPQYASGMPKLRHVMPAKLKEFLNHLTTDGTDHAQRIIPSIGLDICRPVSKMRMETPKPYADNYVQL